MSVRQTVFFCPCGGSPIHARGLCRRCYRARHHSLRHFQGLRNRVLRRDGYRCTGCNSEHLVVHHRRALGATTGIFITLCPKCHAQVHRTLRLRYGRLTPHLLALWREQHRGLAEQIELPLGTGAFTREEQADLFADAA